MNNEQIYYQIKQDLMTFDENDMEVLLGYHDIKKDIVYNDSLWLLAISILNSTKSQFAQMPPTKIWEKYHAELHEKFVRDSSAPKDTTKLPTQMIEADPTSAKKYLKWIVESYIADGIHKFEDMSRTRIALQEYVYLLQKKLVIDKYLLNIDAFCGLRGCISATHEKLGLDKFLDQEQFKDALGWMRYEAEYKNLSFEIEKVHEDADLTVIIPQTYEASCKYGAHTKWCTTSKEHGEMAFTEYSRDGPLYILLPKNPQHKGEKYQVHFPSEQFMDEMDVDIDYVDLLRRFPTIRNIDIPEFKEEEFMTAVLEKDLDTIRDMLSNVDSETIETTMNVAITDDNSDIIELFLEKGVIDPIKVFTLASARDSENIVKLLLKRDVDPSINDNRALSLAVNSDRSNIVRILLNDERVKPNVDIIKMAQLLGNDDIIGMLAEKS